MVKSESPRNVCLEHQNMTFKLPLVEYIWVFKNHHFKSGICLYFQYFSCITILSPTSNTFQYQVLHHKDSVLNDKAIFLINKLVK